MPMSMMNDTEGVDSELYNEQPEGKPEAKSVDEETQEEAGTIVPVSVLTTPGGPPPKVGDEIVVKVAALHGDEAEIIYAPAKAGGESKPGTPAPEMGASEELDQMGKEY